MRYQRPTSAAHGRWVLRGETRAYYLWMLALYAYYWRPPEDD